MGLDLSMKQYNNNFKEQIIRDGEIKDISNIFYEAFAE